MKDKKRTAIYKYIETKDDRLKDDIIKENLPLVVDIINKQFNYPNHHDDMIQEGCLGIVKAINRFDPAKGQFSTLASQAIRNNIIMYLKKSSHEYGSHLHQRANAGDEPLKYIPCDKKSLGVFEAVSHVFNKLPAEDVNILKSKFGLQEGSYTYFQKSKALDNFRKVMKSEGIRRADFYA